MEVTAKSEPTPDLIFQLASNFMSTKHLFAASDLGLFEELGRAPSTLDELASRLHAPSKTLRVLADAMVALGLLERQQDRYQNGPVAAKFLSGQSPESDLRPLLRFWNRISYPRWIKLEDAIRLGHGPSGDFSFSQEEQKIFNEGVESFTNRAARALVGSYDFSRHRRVLDFGGGTGSFLLTIFERWPGLEGTLFELPAACKVARQRLSGHPLSARIKVVEGDFLKDSIPEGHDAVIVANIVHCFEPQQNRQWLRRLRERVPQGARLLLIDLWMNATHTEPLFGALMAGEFLVVAGRGDVYSEAEISQWLSETRWRAAGRQPLTGPVSLVVAEAA